MHILTGLVLAALAGRRRSHSALEGLPRFHTGPIRVAHALRGRIRFLVPSLRGSDGVGLSWPDTLRSLPGVSCVEVSTVSGSVLVVYQPDDVDPARIFGALARLLGLEEELDRPPSPRLTRELRELGESLNHTVYDKTGGVVDLWSLVLVGLAVLGARKMFQSGWAGFPPGFTLLWWAMNSVSRSEESRM